MTDPKPPKALPKDKHILILEDDDHIRDMLKMTLESEGFAVKTLRDGRNLMPTTTQFKPDLVISDVMMPGGGGYDVLRNLMSDEISRHVPVLLMSGYAFDSSTKKMMLAEPNVKGFIEKPIRPTVMILKIHEILNTKSRDEQLMEQRNQETKGMDFNRFDTPF